MKHLKLFVALFAMLALGVGNAWAESETVTFTDKDWAPWTKITSGSGFETANLARGVANNGVNGSCSSTKEYSNVTKISYVASSNTTGGKVTIKVGDTTVGESDITKDNNKAYEYNVDNLSGTITVSVTKPKSKTVWVKSVTISTGGEEPETPEKTATSLVWSAAEYTATIGADNTYPTLTTEPVDLAGVTYASSNTAAATIAADGTITLVAAGTTTITASYAGNDIYVAATDATYTLTVEAATPDPEEPENPEDAPTYDFTNITGFKEWTTSYSKHEVTYSDAKVTFASANKQTQTITDQPVTKGGDVSLVLIDGMNISTVKWVCTQWGQKAQTITLHYSKDGGNVYTSTNITSSDFTISSDNLPAGTNAVKITFSETTNQVGIKSCTITKVEAAGETPDGPTTALDNIAVEGKAVKAIVNGQLIIIKNGVQYNAQGQVIK